MRRQQPIRSFTSQLHCRFYFLRAVYSPQTAFVYSGCCSSHCLTDELPARYADAKIFVFPTEWDPWGVVANEACASGLPVIVSPYAGVAHELIVNDRNGYILELEVEAWTDAAVKLLSDATLYQRFSENSRQQVAEYNFDNSANGLIQAIKQAFWRHKGLPVPDTE